MNSTGPGTIPKDLITFITLPYKGLWYTPGQNVWSRSKSLTCFHEEKAKKKKIQNGRLKKTTFFKIANSQNFFAKISQIGSWVSRID